jgi:hypothetical protein
VAAITEGRKAPSFTLPDAEALRRYLIGRGCPRDLAAERYLYGLVYFAGVDIVFYQSSSIHLDLKHWRSP